VRVVAPPPNPSDAQGASLGAVLRALTPRASALEPAHLEELLRGLVARGRAAWPAFELAAEDFVRHLAGLLSPRDDLPRWLESVHAEDLYLTCACARGSAPALAELDRQLRQAVATATQGARATAHLAEEATQGLRETLLVARAGSAPRIASYRGTGTLRHWLRASAIRGVQRLRQREERYEEGGSALELPGSDPELAFLKQHYRAPFKAAFETALSRLTSQQRTVLRLHLLDGLNIERIGGLYAVHRATVARWIAHSRQLLLEETCRELSRTQGLAQEELHGLFALLRSNLDVSLSRLLLQTR
jgi:RNA polymerase sigma-70 factor (ECF subfamily)